MLAYPQSAYLISSATQGGGALEDFEFYVVNPEEESVRFDC